LTNIEEAVMTNLVDIEGIADAKELPGAVSY
jgi:hypothetical protein